MSHPPQRQAEPPECWGTPRRWLSGLGLLLVALLHVPIVGIAVDSGVSVSSGKGKVFTYWAALVLMCTGRRPAPWRDRDTPVTSR